MGDGNRVVDAGADTGREFFNHPCLNKRDLDGGSEKNKKNENSYDKPEYCFDHRIFNKFNFRRAHNT